MKPADGGTVAAGTSHGALRAAAAPAASVAANAFEPLT